MYYISNNITEAETVPTIHLHWTYEKWGDN